MENKLHKKIIIISIILIVLSSAGIGLSLVLSYGLIMVLSLTLIAFSLISITTSYAIINQKKIWIRKVAKYSLIFLPVFSIGLIYVIIAVDINILSTILIATVLLLFTSLALMHIFLFNDAGKLTGTILLLLIIILGIIFKGYHFPFSSIIISFGLILFSLGIYIYGIRCLYLAGKNSYLKYLSFLGSCFITIAFSGLMFKLQHWPGGSELATIANYSIIIGTTLVLLTLRSSGYIEWQDLHKKIFKRILLPWIFIFVLFIMSFLLPHSFKVILGLTQENVKTVFFKMPDYTIENKNGLEPQ